ncbi:hypothetical protein BDZ45DRAFT_19719 [Acephala macrosclerotiorum]|nr:hypothetical protein BDZ45DRAFT_19719 [Acephala macrosclerotiorum]
MSRTIILGEGEQDDHFSSFLLQASYSEPSIRHLLLAVGSIHLSRCASNEFYGSGAPNSTFQNSHLERRASYHHSLALSHLSALLSSLAPNKAIDAQIWETCFMSIYLFAFLHALLNNKRAVRSWSRTAIKVLRRAFRSFRCRDQEHGMDLPGSMREVALAFGRLNVSC